MTALMYPIDHQFAKRPRIEPPVLETEPSIDLTEPLSRMNHYFQQQISNVNMLLSNGSTSSMKSLKHYKQKLTLLRAAFDELPTDQELTLPLREVYEAVMRRAAEAMEQYLAHLWRNFYEAPWWVLAQAVAILPRAYHARTERFIRYSRKHSPLERDAAAIVENVLMATIKYWGRYVSSLLKHALKVTGWRPPERLTALQAASLARELRLQLAQIMLSQAGDGEPRDALLVRFSSLHGNDRFTDKEIDLLQGWGQEIENARLSLINDGCFSAPREGQVQNVAETAGNNALVDCAAHPLSPHALASGGSPTIASDDPKTREKAQVPAQSPQECLPSANAMETAMMLEPSREELGANREPSLHQLRGQQQCTMSASAPGMGSHLCHSSAVSAMELQKQRQFFQLTRDPSSQVYLQRTGTLITSQEEGAARLQSSQRNSQPWVMPSNSRKRSLGQFSKSMCLSSGFDPAPYHVRQHMSLPYATDTALPPFPFGGHSTRFEEMPAKVFSYSSGCQGAQNPSLPPIREATDCEESHMSQAQSMQGFHTSQVQATSLEMNANCQHHSPVMHSLPQPFSGMRDMQHNAADMSVKAEQPNLQMCDLSNPYLNTPEIHDVMAHDTSSATASLPHQSFHFQLADTNGRMSQSAAMGHMDGLLDSCFDPSVNSHNSPANAAAVAAAENLWGSSAMTQSGSDMQGAGGQEEDACCSVFEMAMRRATMDLAPNNASGMQGLPALSSSENVAGAVAHALATVPSSLLSHISFVGQGLDVGQQTAPRPADMDRHSTESLPTWGRPPFSTAITTGTGTEESFTAASLLQTQLSGPNAGGSTARPLNMQECLPSTNHNEATLSPSVSAYGNLSFTRSGPVPVTTGLCSSVPMPLHPSIAYTSSLSHHNSLQLTGTGSGLEMLGETESSVAGTDVIVTTAETGQLACQFTCSSIPPERLQRLTALAEEMGGQLATCSGLWGVFLSDGATFMTEDRTRLSGSEFERRAGKASHKKWKQSVSVVLPTGRRVKVEQWLKTRRPDTQRFETGSAD